MKELITVALVTLCVIAVMMVIPSRTHEVFVGESIEIDTELGKEIEEELRILEYFRVDIK